MDCGSPVIRLAVFGNPVSQSLSPRIHRAFADQVGLRIDYQALEASADDFSGQVLQLAAHGGTGCNITAPFKQAAFQLAHQLSTSAQRAEAVNTLHFRADGDWLGDNTDGRGLVADLQAVLGGSLANRRVALLGAGGAAAGVLAALMTAGAASIVIANRTLPRAEALVQSHRDLGAVTACSMNALADQEPFDVLINATSQGHAGTAVAVQSRWLRDDGLCYDLNYGPAAVPLQALCQRQGLAYSDGLGMLVGQAAESFRLWTGEMPDSASVLADLRAEQQR